MRAPRGDAGLGSNPDTGGNLPIGSRDYTIAIWGIAAYALCYPRRHLIFSLSRHEMRHRAGYGISTELQCSRV